MKPAVISITTKIKAPRNESSSDRSFGFGTPDQNAPDENAPDENAPDESAPGQGLSVPGAPDENQGTRELTAVGSGFFISPDGYAVTASHVVQDGDTAQIRTDDGKTYTAKVVGNDRVSDLALLKIDGRNDLKYVQFAEQTPRVGDWVLAIGNAFGLGGTVTAGIVSAHGREIASSSSEDLIQIDAPINSGDSGGPSFDTKGRVIGVNTMIFSPSGGSVGIAFAVPAEAARVVIPQLRDKGAVTRGWMGVQIQSVTPDIAEGLGIDQPKGAIVASVDNNGPAAQAGLASGDVITAVGGESVKDAHAVTKKIQGMTPGSSAQLQVLRNGKQQRMDVTLAQFPNQADDPKLNR